MNVGDMIKILKSGMYIPPPNTVGKVGVITAIIYSLPVAFNIGYEVFGFGLLFISAIAIGLWGLLCKHYGILLLQFFYASGGIIGVWRWF